VGHKRDVDLTPLAARTNRLGVKSKAAQQSVPAGKAKYLYLCQHGRQCPIHGCPFAHTPEELAENEAKHREKLQVLRAQKTTRKKEQARLRLEAEIADLPEDAQELARSYQLDKDGSEMWGIPGCGGETSAAWIGDDHSDDASWTEVAPKSKRGSQHVMEQATRNRPPSSAGVSFVTSIPTEAATMAPQPFRPAVMAALRRCVVDECIVQLMEMGIDSNKAAAAAHAAGGRPEFASDLCFSDEPEETWPLQDVNMSKAVAEAVKLLRPPHSYTQASVEAALECCQGDPAAALYVLQRGSRPTPATGSSCGYSAPSGGRSASDWEPQWDDDDAPDLPGALDATAAAEMMHPVSPPPPVPPPAGMATTTASVKASFFPVVPPHTPPQPAIVPIAATADFHASPESSRCQDFHSTEQHTITASASVSTTSSCVAPNPQLVPSHAETVEVGVQVQEVADACSPAGAPNGREHGQSVHPDVHSGTPPGGEYVTPQFSGQLPRQDMHMGQFLGQLPVQGLHTGQQHASMPAMVPGGGGHVGDDEDVDELMALLMS